jgi:hypothetical protein
VYDGWYGDEHNSYYLICNDIQCGGRGGGTEYLNRGCTRHRPLDLQPCHNVHGTHVVRRESDL